MPRPRIGHLAAIGAIVALSGWPSVARAATVIVLDRGGHPVSQNDPAVAAPALTPPPVAVPTRPEPLARAASGRTVRSVLAQLARGHQITRPAYRTYSGEFNSALKEAGRLSSTRGGELRAIVGILNTMARQGTLTASRLPVLFLTLQRNAQYWNSGSLLSYGQRVEFAGSQLVWEYYPGQGIQLQELGSFGKAQWLCAAGARYAARCRAMLSELIPLAVRRAGALVWEYYFNFDGGVPPWTSAMSQGTALQALADAYRRLRDMTYLGIAHQALPLFSAAPPTGVGVSTRLGMRYVQYSFAPAAGMEVINGFLQSLIGLDDYARTSGDPAAKHLFAAGDAEAEAELPQFNTGAWSLYQPGLEDDLSYHQLVTGFLHQLCSMTQAAAYCTTAAAFELDLKTPPALRLLTTHLHTKQPADVYFQVSKVSRVGITVLRNGSTLFLTSAHFPYGRHAFAIPALTRPGTYTVQLDATDLAGNYDQTSAQLRVSR